MKKLTKVAAILMALALIVTSFAACSGSKDTETSTTPDSSASSDTLIMATNANFPPYEYKDGDKIVGIDPEVAQLIADKLGKKLVIEDVEFGSIIAGVQTGKFDMGMAGMTVTPDREKSVNFTDSYATGIQSVIVTADSAIKSLDDLKGDGSMKFGVQQDTTGDIYTTDDYGEDAVIRYNKGADAIQALLTGKVDCVVIDSEPAKEFVAANDGLKILDTEYVEEEYAICVAKDNDELLNQINDVLDKLKSNGKIDEIVNKYISAE